MHINNPTHHFHFFANREVVSLYFTISLVRFAVGLVSVFVPVYLWQLGYPLWQIMFFFFLESFYFVPMTFLMPPLFRRMTDKSLLMLSIPFFVLYFVGLSYLATYPILFFIIPIIFGIKNLMFNTGYHLDFSKASDDKDLGKEIGLRFMIGSLVSLAAPFLGGVLIGLTGFKNVFLLTSVILVVAVLPLWFFPKRRVSSKLNAKGILKTLFDKKLKYNTLGNIGYANEFVVSGVVWGLFLFLAIGSIEKFGGIVSLALFVSALVTFFAGMLSDTKRRKKVLSSTTGVLSVVWVSRTAVTTALGAAISHIVLNLFYPALLVAWSRNFYHMAKTSPNPTEFILGRELLMHITRTFFIGLLVILAFVYSQSTFFTISFILAAMVSVFFLFSNKQDITLFEKK